MCFHNLCEFILVSIWLCLDNTLSLESSITPGSSKALTSFFIKVSEPVGEEFDKDIPCRVECSKVSYSLHIEYLWASMLITTLQEEVSLSGLSNALIYV